MNELGSWCLTHDVPYYGMGHALPNGQDDTGNCVRGMRSDAQIEVFDVSTPGQAGKIVSQLVRQLHRTEWERDKAVAVLRGMKDIRCYDEYGMPTGHATRVKDALSRIAIGAGTGP